MKARIITIGDELLIGQVIDTNSAWIASELTKLGFQVEKIISISDNGTAIDEEVNQSMANAPLTLVTGGLGPTKDDITKNILSHIFLFPLEFNEAIFRDVENFIQMRGGKMNPLNRDQALFPVGARWLRNRQGTAPGMWFEKNQKVVISLPGVPSEMKGIMNQEVIPALTEYFNIPATIYQTLMLTGIAESQLALNIEKWENNLPQGMKLAYLPSPGIVRLRLGYVHPDAHEARRIIGEQIALLKPLILENLFSETEQTLELTLVNLLKYRNKTVSTAESCTGGTIAGMLTSVPGSSAVFKGAIVAYSNEIKQKVLQVDASLIQTYGAVSQQVVEQMVAGALNKLESDFAIATSGIAGPDGGTPEKPVGMVWVAVASKNKIISKKFQFGSERSINITRSSLAALNMLRELLLSESETKY